MNKNDILNSLAHTLSFSETRRKFPTLTDNMLRDILIEAADVLEESASIPAHKVASSADLTLYIDGASRGNPGKAAVGIVIMDQNRHVIGEKGKYIGETTNNMAEYRALLEALVEAKRLGGKTVHIYSDSELLVRQMNGVYKVRDSKLMELYAEAKEIISGFKRFKIEHVTRDKNTRADSLANEALDGHLKKR